MDASVSGHAAIGRPVLDGAGRVDGDGARGGRIPSTPAVWERRRRADNEDVRLGDLLYLRWCQRTGRAWQSAAGFIGLFMTWLQHAPTTATQAEWDPRGSEVRVGPGVEPARGARRVNVVLSAVRGFLLHAASYGEVPQEVLAQLYEVADARDLPIEARGIDARVRLRARHRMREAKPDIDRATNDVVALEEQNADLRLRLEERDQELQAARDSNRELMSALNSRR
ncbi:hypothetical protein ACQEVF_42590 [Nonomuraea polychroma]|uniref:hypothetical protein n=1 Tax=Nonomuraea polychroma TaxID=46176 RepID=UPI003D944F34